MTRKELAAAVAAATNLSKADARASVDALFAAIADALQRQDTVRITGFGAFTVTRRAATTGRNPSTGEAIRIEAANQPRFKPGKTLKDALN